MNIGAIGAGSPLLSINMAAVGPSNASASSANASGAFGLDFEDLLRIVLTQLTYQDPLKPMDNAEFVSQLAQFSQIQQAQTMSDRLLSLLQAQAATQATSVLGRMVDIDANGAVLTGRVTSISFQAGEPRLVVTTGDGQTISNLALSSVSRIALED
jgi:flagellar basal-body rod modification protein FlgD